MDIKLLVGKRVKELRDNLRISQEELADLTGLDRTYITSVECDKRNILIVNIEKLANALKVTPRGDSAQIKQSIRFGETLFRKGNNENSFADAES